MALRTCKPPNCGPLAVWHTCGLGPALKRAQTFDTTKVGKPPKQMQTINSLLYEINSLFYEINSLLYEINSLLYEINSLLYGHNSLLFEIDSLFIICCWG